jgi:hypothetical protein
LGGWTDGQLSYHIAAREEVVMTVLVLDVIPSNRVHLVGIGSSTRSLQWLFRQVVKLETLFYYLIIVVVPFLISRSSGRGGSSIRDDAQWVVRTVRIQIQHTVYQI